MDPQIGDQLYSIFQEGYHRAATSGNPSVTGVGMNPPGSYNGYLPAINTPLLENEFPATQQANTFGSNNGWNHYNGSEVDFSAITRGATFNNPNPQQFHQNEFYNGSIDLNPALLNFGSYPPEMLSSEAFNPTASAVASTTATSPMSNIPVADPYGNAWPKHEPLPAFSAQDDSKNIFSSGNNDTPLHNSFFDNPQSNKLSVASPGSSHPDSPLSPATTMGSMGDSGYPEHPRKRGASSGGRSSAQGGAGGRGKRRKTDDTPNPEVRAQKEKERRVSNNSRERMRIRDINDALTELGRVINVCMSLKPMGKSNAEKPQTKLGVLNMAVDVIMQLEKKVRERNLNPSNVALQHRGAASTAPSPPQPQSTSQQSFQNSFQNMASHQR